MRHVRIYSIHYVAETVCHRCGKENFRDDEKNWGIRQREREREKWCEEREKISFLEIEKLRRKRSDLSEEF